MRKSIQLLALIPISFGTLLGNFNPIHQPNVLAQYEMSLDNRYPDKWVNEVFKDNILLNLAYLQHKNIDPEKINWDELNHPFTYQFQLDPDSTFAFHDDVLEKYRNKVAITSNAHFNSREGFKTDGYLFGDGVCHLASLIYLVAKHANLEAEAPTNHDFMPIPEIPKEYGVSIYSNPFSKGTNAQQNLYITNNKDKPVSFNFEYKDNKVKVAVVEQ